jgi:hypothetical protein
MLFAARTTMPLRTVLRPDAQPSEAIALRTLPSLTHVTSSTLDNETCCPITSMPIASYAARDIHTTLDGIAYYRPALKVWLSNHDTMPHNNLSVSDEELKRLWPDASARRCTLGPKAIAIGLGAMAPPGIIAGGVLLFKSLPQLQMRDADKMTAITVEAYNRCLTSRSALCFATEKAALLEAWKNSIVDMQTPGTIVLAVGVGCALGSLIYIRKANQARHGEQAGLTARPRPVTEREMYLARV